MAEYTVTGMTCAHCVAAVQTELGRLPGVESVDVDLESGRVVVHGGDPTREQVAAAVDEAGYSLA
jgi:copper chaperone